VLVRRISSGDDQSGDGRPDTTVLRPSHLEPLIPVDGGSQQPGTAAPARRRVVRD